MSNYNEINARLLAERDVGKKQPLTSEEITARMPDWLDELERLAAQYHQLWEAKGFKDAYTTWLPVEGTEKLARRVVYPSKDSDDYDSSDTFVMIDGRLMHYMARRHSHSKAEWGPGISVRCSQSHFELYREFVMQQLEDGNERIHRRVCGDIGRLDYMIQNI